MTIAEWSEETAADLLGPVIPNLAADPSRLSELASDPTIDVRVTELDSDALKRLFGADRDRWPSPGTVISQKPRPGERAKEGIVDVEVAGEWDDVSAAGPVPDVVGLSADEGQERLSAEGYSSFLSMAGPRELAQRFGPSVDEWPEPGRVVAQRMVDESTERERVELIVADWSAALLLPESIPDLTGFSAAAAIAALEREGIGYEIRNVPVAADPGQVLAQDVQVNDSFDGAKIVLMVGELAAAGDADTDRDAVPDRLDQCPDTPVGSRVDAVGCSAGEIAAELEYGLYSFDPGTREMEAERDPPYQVSIVLQTALERPQGLNTQPSARDFLESTGRAPDEIEARLDEIRKQSGRDPLVERWAGSMTMELVPSDPGAATVSRGPGNIERRTVQRGETTWTWNVTPHCISSWTSPFSCRPLTLRATATAHIGVDGNFSYTLFENEQITVAISGATYFALMWQEYKELVLGAIVIPLLGWLVVLGWKRYGPNASPRKRPVNVILVMGANPLDTGRLDLGAEVQAINDSIRSATHRECFQLQQHWATSASDIDNAFAQYQPSIVHFSAHGSQVGELVLNRDGDAMGVATPVASLNTLFRLVGQDVKLVILNACYSEPQAEALSQHVDAVIGMTRAIGDPTAIAFAKSFYAALADGRSLETAFNLACAEAGFEEFEGGEIPTLIASPTVRARTFVGA